MRLGSGIAGSMKGLLAATLVATSVIGGGTPAAAVVPQVCTDGMVTLMQQTTMDVDSAYRLHQASLEELRLSFGDRVGAVELLSAAQTNLLNIQFASLSAVVAAVNAYEPPLTATVTLSPPTLTYSAVGSTTYSVFAPANAVDGNDTTKWSSIKPVPANWLMVDLGGPFLIDRFRMFQATHSDWKASAYTVQSADSGTGPWTDRHLYAAAAPSDSGVVAFASGPATARYWRILANAGGGNGWEVYTFALLARAITVQTVDPNSCLDGLTLQLQELIAAGSAGLDAILADLRLSLALLPLPFVSPPVVVPASKDDCKDGSWQVSSLAFKNQGDCVSWVVVGTRISANTEKTKGN